MANYYSVEAKWAPVFAKGRSGRIVEFDKTMETNLMPLPDFLRPVRNRTLRKSREEIKALLIQKGDIPASTFTYSIKYWAKYEVQLHSAVPIFGSIILRCRGKGVELLGETSIKLRNTDRWYMYGARNGINFGAFELTDVVKIGSINRSHPELISSAYLSHVLQWSRTTEGATILFYQWLSPVNPKRPEQVHLPSNYYYKDHNGILVPDGGYIEISKEQIKEMAKPYSLLARKKKDRHQGIEIRKVI